MPFVSAKCTNCGANLEVDNTKDAAVCPYCNTPYVIEKAVNYFNTTNHISTGVVNVYGGNSAEFVIRAGELLKYNGAATEVYIPNTVKRIAGWVEEVAGIMGITRKRVRQIENKCLLRGCGRHPGRSRKLREYLDVDEF